MTAPTLRGRTGAGDTTSTGECLRLIRGQGGWDVRDVARSARLPVRVVRAAEADDVGMLVEFYSAILHGLVLLIDAKE